MRVNIQEGNNEWLRMRNLGNELMLRHLIGKWSQIKEDLTFTPWKFSKARRICGLNALTDTTMVGQIHMKDIFVIKPSLT